MTLGGAGVILAPLPYLERAVTNISWDTLPEASAENMRAADMLIRTSDGQERRTMYDGGWLLYADATHTDASRQAVPPETPTHLSIDGLAAGTVTTHRRGIPLDVWSNSTLQPYAIGEVYQVNLAFKASKAVSSAIYVRVELVVGADYSTIIAEDRRALIKGSGVDDFVFFSGSVPVTAAMCEHGARFMLVASEAVSVWQKSIFMQRTYTP